MNISQVDTKRKNTSPRLGFIDSLKGIAILLIIASHLPWAGVHGLNLRFFPDLGISLFFMVSAYSLCASWSKESYSSGYYGRFWKRRLIKIAPLYWVMVLISWGIIRSGFTFGPVTPELAVTSGSWTNLFLHLSFMYGLFPTYGNALLFGEWFLFCLLSFYALFPLMWRWFGKSLKNSFILLGISAGVFFLFTVFIPFEFSQGFASTWFPRHLLSFTTGIVLWNMRGVSISKWRWGLLLIFFISCMLQKFLFVLPLLVFVASLLVLLTQKQIFPVSWLHTSVLRFLGQHSYSLYLWNIWAIFFTIPALQLLQLPQNIFTRLGMVMVLLTVGAWMLEKLAKLLSQFLENVFLHVRSLFMQKS